MKIRSLNRVAYHFSTLQADSVTHQATVVFTEKQIRHPQRKSRDESVAMILFFSIIAIGKFQVIDTFAMISSSARKSSSGSVCMP